MLYLMTSGNPRTANCKVHCLGYLIAVLCISLHTYPEANPLRVTDSGKSSGWQNSHEKCLRPTQMKMEASTSGQRQKSWRLSVRHKMLALSAGSLNVCKPRELGTRDGRKWQVHS